MSQNESGTGPLAIRQVGELANMFNIKGSGTELVDVLLATAFRTENEVTPAQMVALAVVAQQYKLNPFTKEIYAFPDKNKGIVPIVGVDGWTRIINEHPQMQGIEFVYSDVIVNIDDDAKPCPEWIACRIYRKDRDRPIEIREYLDENYRPAFEKEGRNGKYKITGPWQTHTKRFLRHKTTIQCARLAFGFAGIFDPDEGDKILEAMEIEIQGRAAPTATKDKPSRPKAKADAKPEERQEQVKDAVKETVEVVDDETGEVTRAEKVDNNPATTESASNGMVEYIKRRAEAKGIDVRDILERFSIADIDSASEETCHDIIAWIRTAGTSE